MIGRPEDLFKDLLKLCPEFSKSWQDEAYLWTDDDGTFTHCGVFMAFSHHIADILKRSEPHQLESVFRFVESCMNDNDEDVSTAAATCFLENLMNRTPELIDPKHFVPLLGPESKDYCRAWDEFCGVRTAGLW
ncbi:MAG TPA: hypothetical protein VF952_05720 [Chloroflexia bacterium]